MDLLFSDPSEIPLPPAEVRIRAIQVIPSADHSRLRVQLEVDPFQRRPNLDFVVLAADGRKISETSIIESWTRKVEFTMHLDAIPASTSCRLLSTLYYVEIEQPDQGEGVIERQVIDSKEVTFEL